VTNKLPRQWGPVFGCGEAEDHPARIYAERIFASDPYIGFVANTLVVHVQTGLVLDLTDLPDLGQPGRPGLLTELYYDRKTPRYREGELQCPDCRENNPACPEWMFLRLRLGRFHAVHRNPVLGDHKESDTHKALKERMVTAAEQGGLTAVAESRAANGRRRTDVVVTGGSRNLACEAQISYATTTSVRDRARRASDDGLTPLWATLNPAADWIGRVPWARLDRKPWNYYRDEAELPVLGGIRTLTIEECGRTGEPCPDKTRGRRCTGRHGRWNAVQVTHFDDLLVRAAHGEFLPYQDRSRRRENWFWVFPDDLELVRQENDATGAEPGPASVLVGDDQRELDPSCSYEATHTRSVRPKPRPSGAAEESLLVALADPKRTVSVPRQLTLTPATSINEQKPVYRQLVINPGTLPLDDVSEDLAAANLTVFLAAVRVRATELEKVEIRHRVAGISGEPVRTPDADRDGRFGWSLPLSDGGGISVLMPGVDLARLRDDLTAQAPMLYIDGVQGWWADAVGSAANVGMELKDRSGLPERKRVARTE
jgi:hypothetical protein